MMTLSKNNYCYLAYRNRKLGCKILYITAKITVSFLYEDIKIRLINIEDYDFNKA